MRVPSGDQAGCSLTESSSVRLTSALLATSTVQMSQVPSRCPLKTIELRSGLHEGLLPLPVISFVGAAPPGAPVHKLSDAASCHASLSDEVTPWSTVTLTGAASVMWPASS